MGIDANLFVDGVDDELMCSICTDVLEVPVQVMPCQHLYCSQCLTHWLSVRSICPLDGRPVTSSSVTSVPRTICNILSKLMVRCDGCVGVMPLHRYQSHDCFQHILTQMRDYIQQIDELLLTLQPNHSIV